MRPSTCVAGSDLCFSDSSIDSVGHAVMQCRMRVPDQAEAASGPVSSVGALLF